MNTPWPAHAKTSQRLQLVAKNPAHAYLLCGTTGQGTIRVAVFFAAEILGIELSENELDLTHPNLFIVEPEENKKKISVEQIHRLISRSHQTSYVAGLPRIFVINNADKLSHEAATALLKTLEEPNDNIVFILVAQSRTSVLPTIRSRVVSITILALPKEEIVHYLGEKYRINPGRAAGIVELANGEIEKAISLLEPEKFEAATKQNQLTYTFSEGTISEKFAIAKQAAEHDRPGDFLERLYYATAQESSILVIASNQENILAAEKQLASNVNARLVLENLALQWSKTDDN